MSVSAPAPALGIIRALITLDDTLMSALSEGTGEARERAFQELVRRNAGPLTRWVSCVLRDPAQVEDVVQDTFLRVFEARERYAPGKASFRTWLFRIARNRALDLVRQAKRRGEERLASDCGAVDPAHGPLAELGLRERGALMRSAIDELASADREVLLLRLDEELSYEEIAEFLASSPTAVKQRVFRARKQLRTLLEDA